MKNRELAKIMTELADIMEMQDIQWKPRAYRQAARKIENMSENIVDIYKKKGVKGLQEIPSIGKSLARHIADYIETGRVEKWDKLRKESTKGLYQLISIEGLGPNKVKELAQKLGIKNLDDLKKAVKQKKIRQLEGFGEKSEENIIQSLKQYEKSRERMLIGRAWTIAWEVIDYLKQNTSIRKIDYAGSLRRMKETVGDIDILVVAKDPEKLMETFAGMPEVARVLVKGRSKTSVILKEGMQIDVRAIDEKSYGAAHQYFTGSKDHNIALRKIAVRKGYKLSEYGLYRKSSNKLVAGKKEKDIYSKLGLQWIPPELRENNGEIEAAIKKKLPNLVELKDIKGDLQMHTTYSDGQDSIREMALQARKLGYGYISITDHSKSERIAHGMDEDRLRKQWKEIESVSEKIKIFKSAEVDIKKDGSLDYDDNTLKKLDIVLVSVHSGFKSGRKEMTERIIKALDNPYVNILAHPTGRMIQKRQGYDADFERIFRKCSERNVALEINCDPRRLDLNDNMIISAKKAGVKFSLGTDSHNAGSLSNMRFGLGQARRAWLEKKDIINTMSCRKIAKYFRKHK